MRRVAKTGKSVSTHKRKPGKGKSSTHLPGEEARKHRFGIVALRQPQIRRFRAIGCEVVHEDVPTCARKRPFRLSVSLVCPEPVLASVRFIVEGNGPNQLLHLIFLPGFGACGKPDVWLMQLWPLQ